MSSDRPSYDPVSVSPLSFWERTATERDASFKILRDERPVSWHPPLEGSLMEAEQDGFWAVTRHEDVVAISKNPEVFCSGQGVMIEEVPEDLLEAAQSFLAMDAPRHGALRRLVSVAFTPRQIAKIDEQIKAQARHIVDDLLDTTDGDFVSQVSKRLPMWTIYELIGLPESLREEAAHHADGMVSWADADVAAGREPGEVLNDSLVGLISIAFEMVEDRKTHPRDDILTNLVQAEVDGQRLTDEEIASFFVLLSVAGNDTTRNSTTLGMKYLCDFPEQRKLLADDPEGLIQPAAEEIVRYATPVMTFRRTATRDVELHGQQIREGDWVVTLFSSANRDEREFDHPEEFDITRTPNRHVAFGGGGPHFCMGSMLARTQLRSLFSELVTRAPALELGEPSYLVGNFVHAVKSIPYQLSAR
ncbi:MAG TPA: cytochrome P450 [Mycobacteriales bacterium]|jgi:cytochrome P450|nr:cytochrome P450 [Mycobacteriales bacterium]